MAGGQQALLRLGTVFAVAPLLVASGCGLPSLHIVPSSASITPSVVQLQDHITCTLVDAIDGHLGEKAIERLREAKLDPNHDRDYQLWQKLVDYNVQDTVNLTLAVTQTQGLNPSVSFITPLTALGHGIEKIVDTSNGITTPTNATSGSYSRALTLGFGLNGTEFHNIVITYTMDIHKIYDAMYYIGEDGLPHALQNGAISVCHPENKGALAKTSKGLPYGLTGDLGLPSAMEKGLNQLDRQTYSPAVAGSGSPPLAGRSGSSATLAQSAGASSYSEKIDFTFAWGANGGPNWTLLKLKGPTGGNTPPVSYTRSKDDTLISTFGATCHADRNVDLNDGRYFYAPVVKPQAGAFSFDGATRAFELRAYLRRQPDLKVDFTKAPPPLPHSEGSKEFYADVSQIIYFELVLGKDDSKLDFTYSGSGSGAMTIAYVPTPTQLDAEKHGKFERPPNMNGTIAASTFVTGSSKQSSYSVRGALSDGVSGSFVGNMHAGVTVTSATTGRINNLYISQNALRLILEETGGIPADIAPKLIGEKVAGYWASLPSCSTAAPFLLNSQTVLQRLPRDVAETLQQ